MRKCLLIASLATAFSINAYGASFASGSYPNWSTSHVGNRMMSTASHALTQAIEKGNVVQLKDTQSMREFNKAIFHPNTYGDYMSDKLNTASVQKGLQKIVGEFLCTEYRYRTRKNSAKGCVLTASSSETVENMPFLNPPYLDNKLVVNLDNQRNRVSYEFYVESGNSQPKSSPLGPIHEMGAFFGNQFESKQLKLTVRVLAYKLTEDGFRHNAPIVDKPSTIFVVLPTASQIAKAGSQLKARELGLSKAELIDIR